MHVFLILVVLVVIVAFIDSITVRKLRHTTWQQTMGVLMFLACLLVIFSR